MARYQKIDTVFKRDINNIIMPYEPLVNPTLEWLRQFNVKFDGEEKIDGTNIRLEITHEIGFQSVKPGNLISGVVFTVNYKGKTDNASIPAQLEDYLRKSYPEEKILQVFKLKKFIAISEFEDYGWGTYEDTRNKTGFIPDVEKIPEVYVIHGEGYGGRIQKAGPHYISKGVGFRVFDVQVGNWYLLRPDRDNIAALLGAPIAPFIGEFTIDEAIEFVKKGFKSRIAEDPEFLAEGLVLRTPVGLKNRAGLRIIFKIKTCDWNKYYAKYGTYDKVDQVDNPNYALNDD